MSDPAADRWDHLRRTELLDAVADVLSARMFLAPVGFAILSLFFWYEPAIWRRAILAFAVPLFLTVVIVESRRARRGTLGGAAATGNAAVMLGGLFIAATATGGIESPAMPGCLIMVMLAGLLGAARGARLIWMGALAAIVTLATIQAAGWFPHALPELFGGHEHAPVTALAVFRGVGLVVMTTAAYLLATRTRAAFDRLADRAHAASRAAVEGLADEHRTLALLTAEIAHELKNPLASVKGLAGLVARDVQGKSAERMVVLRREVDRMQEVLEQFLTLSRPVVPLEVAAVDPRELCDEVAALHEGVAADRGVRVEVRGPRGLALSADHRKLVQVLTNLVQNALAASPRGGAIALEVAAEPGAVALRVVDGGPGLPVEVAGRAFEPGVTTKPDGSGLGLAIARSLARQHGGELALEPRADRAGLVATVRLPAEAAA